MKRLLCLVSLLLAVGCASVRFRPYVGDQQAWPMAEGSIVNTQYELPIFTSLPSAPYQVLGEVRIESPIYAQAEERHLEGMVTASKELGADALVFVDGAIFFSTNYGPAGDAKSAGGAPAATLSQVNHFSPQAFMPNISVLAIKWTGQRPSGLPEKYLPAKPVAPEEKKVVEPAPAPAAPKTDGPTTNFGPKKSAE